MTLHLFSYGTLQPQFAPAEVREHVLKMQVVGRATRRGELFDLGEYPGAVIGPRSSGNIEGTVLKLPNAAALTELDKYEEVDSKHPARGLFVRRRRFVKMNDGRRVLCWVYEVTQRPVDKPKIVGGRFLGSRSSISKRKRAS